MCQRNKKLVQQLHWLIEEMALFLYCDHRKGGKNYIGHGEKGNPLWITSDGYLIVSMGTFKFVWREKEFDFFLA